MCDIDLEASDLYSITERKARKTHRCDACRGPIVPGERYEKHFMVQDGTAITEKCCRLCADAMAEFAKAHHGQHSNPAYFVELLSGCIGPHDDDGLSARWTELRDALDARRSAAQEVQER